MKYLTKRLISYAAVIAAVSQLDFFLPRIAPGTPIALVPQDCASSCQQLAALLNAEMGLNKPLYVQYIIYMKDIFLHWPPYFSVSQTYFPTPVLQLFLSKIGWTLLLVGGGIVLSLLAAFLVSSLGSLKRGGKVETSSVYGAIILQSTPVYWTGLILLWTFGVTLHWLPIFGNVSPTIPAGFTAAYVGSVLVHWVLPVTAMAGSMFGEMFLIIRGSTQEVLKTEYVLAAKMRGLKERTVAFYYILRNSMLPLVSVLSFSLASLIGRAVLIEIIFGYNGVGSMIVNAVSTKDYPVIEGSLFLITLIIVAGGLIGDMILLRIDPRLRIQR